MRLWFTWEASFCWMAWCYPAVVADVVSFNGMEEDELLRLAACLEEHFPHSMANAVVSEAVHRGLEHEEMHSRVDYIVAHGIATYVGEERVIEAAAVIRELKGCGFKRIVMMTGDSDRTAGAIARKVGVDDCQRDCGYHDY